MLRVLDLFSGIGGFSIGLERTGGFKTVAFCEINPFARQVLAKHWPEVPCYDDVRTLTAERLAADGIAVDLICGGFPCQDLSIAGRGLGLQGERSGLWREFARIIGEVRPRNVLLENVSAILHRGLGDVLGDLCRLGYDAEWGVIPAGAAGAIHVRPRLWLVAYPEGLGSDGRGSVWAAGQSAKHARLGTGDLWTRRAQSCPVGVDDGVQNRLDRIGALGNAVVPAIPELIGRAILQARAAA